MKIFPASLPALPSASRLGKVALLMGGWAAEREISLQSGRAVLTALQTAGVDTVAIDVNQNIVNVLQEHAFDRAFNVLHGRGGEDGTIQSILEVQKIPYTGSGVLASAICMDKYRSKLIWRALGLPTPDFMLLDDESDCEQALGELGLPLIVKPIFEGSSIGIHKVEQASELLPAWQQAKQYGPVLAECWIDGQEYTVGILQGQALPLIRLETSRTFYDYQAKYVDNDTQYHCPCGLDESQETDVQALALQAFAALSAQGWGRVDFMLDSQQQPYLIEVNTVPGMTDHSLVPMAAEASGVDFVELVLRILATSLIDRSLGSAYDA